jgi:hypothetical protein
MLLMLCLAGTPLAGQAQLAPLQAPQQYDARRWRAAVGTSLGTPGGLGAQLEVKVLGPIWARAVVRGIWGTLPRGAGVDIDVARGADGRLYLTAMAGTIACYGDRDGGCSGTPLYASHAWSAGIGGEFPISRTLGVGVEVERWLATSGEQPSLYAANLLIRAHL